MDTGDLYRVEIIAILLVLFLFVPINSESVYGECISKSYDELSSFSVNIPNYSLSEKLLNDRFIQTTFIARMMEVTFIKPHESVKIQILSYDDEGDAASDATVFPTTTESKEWMETTFRGHPAYERAVQINSSEYVDYIFELRVVDGCIVVRGLWKEKTRVVEPLVTLEEGKTSVDTVVGAVVDEIDGRIGVYVEPPGVNDTSSTTTSTSSTLTTTTTSTTISLTTTTVTSTTTTTSPTTTQAPITTSSTTTTIISTTTTAPTTLPTTTQASVVDSDNDGWTDKEEYKIGTDPYKKDTDGDGYWDRQDPNPLNPNIPEKQDAEPQTGENQIIYGAGILLIIVIGVSILILRKRKPKG